MAFFFWFTFPSDSTHAPLLVLAKLKYKILIIQNVIILWARRANCVRQLCETPIIYSNLVAELWLESSIIKRCKYRNQTVGGKHSVYWNGSSLPLTRVHTRARTHTHTLSHPLSVSLSLSLSLCRELMGTEAMWPWLMALGGLPAILQFVTLLFFPEAPRYLYIDKGDTEGCRKGIGPVQAWSITLHYSQTHHREGGGLVMFLLYLSFNYLILDNKVF